MATKEFNKDEVILGQLKKDLGQFIAFCASRDKMSGWTVAVVQYGTAGYSPLHNLYYGTEDQMRAQAAALNKLAGISEQKAMEFITSSMVKKAHK